MFGPPPSRQDIDLLRAEPGVVYGNVTIRRHLLEPGQRVLHQRFLRRRRHGVVDHHGRAVEKQTVWLAIVAQAHLAADPEAENHDT